MDALRRLILIGLLCLSFPTLARTQETGPSTAFARLCGAPTVSEEWFAPEFLAAAPLSAVQQLFAVFRDDLGTCGRVTQTDAQYVLVYDRGVVIVVRYALDAQGRFTTLLLRPRMAFSDMAEAARAFAALPGTVALLVTRDGRTHAAWHADRPLAVGSTFKLSVLAALLEHIRLGRRRWEEVVTTRPEWMSLPSGIVQNAPPGTGFIVSRLAELMISISDNTATDMLIRLMGREAVEAAAPPRNRPFLMTREAFILKDPRNADLLARWRSGDEANRREVLREAAGRPLPDLRSFGDLLAAGPMAPDVEWFYTADELCAAMRLVSTAPVMHVNPGLADPADWKSVAYKGGSEPGVLNLTTEVTRPDGATFCVAATWNHTAAVTDLKLYSRYAGLLHLLRSLQ